MTRHANDSIAALTGREPITVAADATLRQVAHVLWVESVGALVVGDPGHPAGVISERDVVGALAQGADPDTITAGETMTAYVISARLDDRVFEAASQMLEDGIRHLPVVDDYGAVVGMVSVRDLVHPLLMDALGG